MVSFSRRRALLRGALRLTLPAAGAALAVALTGQSAHAAVTSVAVDPGTPSPAVTGDTLTWDIAADQSDTLTCSVDDGTTTLSGPTDCSGQSTYAFITPHAGSYTLTVSDGTNPPLTSAPAIQVSDPTPPPSLPAPAAPSPAVVTATPGTDTSPT